MGSEGKLYRDLIMGNEIGGKEGRDKEAISFIENEKLQGIL